MISRRRFLAGSGAVAAGGLAWFRTGPATAFGAGGSVAAGSASSLGTTAGRLLPAFEQPRHLH